MLSAQCTVYKSRRRDVAQCLLVQHDVWWVYISLVTNILTLHINRSKPQALLMPLGTWSVDRSYRTHHHVAIKCASGSTGVLQLRIWDTVYLSDSRWWWSVCCQHFLQRRAAWWWSGFLTARWFWVWAFQCGVYMVFMLPSFCCFFCCFYCCFGFNLFFFFCKALCNLVNKSAIQIKL